MRKTAWLPCVACIPATAWRRCTSGEEPEATLPISLNEYGPAALSKRECSSLSVCAANCDFLCAVAAFVSLVGACSIVFSLTNAGHISIFRTSHLFIGDGTQSKA